MYKKKSKLNSQASDGTETKRNSIEAITNLNQGRLASESFKTAIGEIASVAVGGSAVLLDGPLSTTPECFVGGNESWPQETGWPPKSLDKLCAAPSWPRCHLQEDKGSLTPPLLLPRCDSLVRPAFELTQGEAKPGQYLFIPQWFHPPHVSILCTHTQTQDPSRLVSVHVHEGARGDSPCFPIF